MKSELLKSLHGTLNLNRCSILLYNAIIMLEDEGLSKEEILDELGMSSEEYYEVYERCRDNI